MFNERREHLNKMKNKYLTRCLCITLVSGMLFTGPTAAFAAGDVEAVTESNFVSEPEDDFISVPETPTPGPDVNPTPDVNTSPTPVPDVSPTPGPDVSPTPGPDVSPTPGPDVSPTPGPDVSPTPGPDVTPTPVPDVSPTPTPILTVQDIINKINEIALETITLEKHKEIVVEIREAYDKLSEEEKKQVSNYKLFEEIEKTIKALEDELKQPNEEELPFTDDSKPIMGDGTDITNTPPQIGQAVYFTNMVSNLHAGKDFYLNSLKKNYQLSFSEDFADVMDEIEKEYKDKNKLKDASDISGSVTSSADNLLVRNWQDVLAIYIYEQNKKGKDEFKLDESCKKELSRIFAELNPVVRDKKNITLVTYGNRHINYYIKKNKIPRSERKILKKYVETDCKLLCATVTGAKGFVRQSVGDNVAEERVNVIADAYSLVGKVGYFWGGKSTVIGEDPSWGSAAKVTATGSNSTGTLRAYGLDCSGFVTWAVVNGYKDKVMEGAVGNGTSDQWTRANVVSEAEAQPGDLVFQRGPEAGSDNHVGILCGKTDAGDWIAVHCSANKNGVTVGEAYSAGFRYIRQPSFYPSQEEKQQMEANSTAQASSGSSFTSAVTVNDSLQDVINSGKNTVKDNKFTDFVGPQLSILQDKIVLADNEIEVFKAE